MFTQLRTFPKQTENSMTVLTDLAAGTPVYVNFLVPTSRRTTDCLVVHMLLKIAPVKLGSPTWSLFRKALITGEIYRLISSNPYLRPGSCLSSAPASQALLDNGNTVKPSPQGPAPSTPATKPGSGAGAPAAAGPGPAS